MSKYLSMAQSAAITTAAVLLVVYVLRKAPVIGPIAGPIVNKALVG